MKIYYLIKYKFNTKIIMSQLKFFLKSLLFIKLSYTLVYINWYTIKIHPRSKSNDQNPPAFKINPIKIHTVNLRTAY